MLRDGGVKVDFAVGEEATAARLLNQPFRKHARTGLPLVTLKLAMSLDGRTTTAAGDSPWISGEASRELVHRWRAESDAIAVGIGTVLADDPHLTARPPMSMSYFFPHSGKKYDIGAVRQPLRVVFDRRARLPLDSRLLQTLDESPLLVVASVDADAARRAALREAGAEIVVADGIEAALAELGRRGVTSLFLEGGRTLAGAFTQADAIDQVRTFVAPVLLGSVGRAGPVGAGDPPLPAAAEASSGALPPTPPPARATALSSEVETVDEDALIMARFKEW